MTSLSKATQRGIRVQGYINIHIQRSSGGSSVFFSHIQNLFVAICRLCIHQIIYLIWRWQLLYYSQHTHTHTPVYAHIHVHLKDIVCNQVRRLQQIYLVKQLQASSKLYIYVRTCASFSDFTHKCSLYQQRGLWNITKCCLLRNRLQQNCACSKLLQRIF